MELLNINGFTTKLPDFPEEINNYNYSLVVRLGNSTLSYTYILVCFNSDFEMVKLESGHLRFIFTGENGFAFNLPKFNSTSWNSLGERDVLTTSLTGGVMQVVMCSDSLAEFSGELNNSNFVFNAPEPVAFVVSNSVKDVEFGDVFFEIFSILPVVLTICISFLAIRKGISFIRNLLVKS